MSHDAALAAVYRAAGEKAGDNMNKLYKARKTADYDPWELQGARDWRKQADVARRQHREIVEAIQKARKK